MGHAVRLAFNRQALIHVDLIGVDDIPGDAVRMVEEVGFDN